MTEDRGRERPLRADARRKRSQVVAAALAELAEVGPDRRLSLEAVAGRAGVGIGTVYRHFPSREALLAAVYDEELGRLCAGVPALLAAMDPDDALLAWMGRYADFVDSKRAMGEDLGRLIAAGSVTQAGTRARLAAAVAALLEAGAATGALRADVAAEDVVALMAGALVASVGDRPREQAERLLAVLIDGLRPRDRAVGRRAG